MAITRRISTTNKALVAPINYVYGETAVSIVFTLSDFNIPTGATAAVYASVPGGSVYTQTATISGNDITISPVSGLFQPGKNAVQVEISIGNKKLITFAVTVNCENQLSENGSASASSVRTSAQIDADVSQIKEDLSDLDDRVEALEDGSGGGSGLSDEAAGIICTLFSEAVYGSDQSSNVARLRELLVHVTVSSISATCSSASVAVGTAYSSLPLTVTATYSDNTTATVTGYTVTAGTVTAGTNTVTVTYEGKTASVTVNGVETVTHSVTYNLTNTTCSSSVATVEDGGYYSATISVNDDCEMQSVTVTMGGTDITSTAYSSGSILIQSVTGDVVITATAADVEYIDDVYTYDNRITAINAYSDNGVTALGNPMYSNNSLVYTKHNLAASGTFTVEIENTTEEEITTERIVIGSLPSYLNDGDNLSKQHTVVYNAKNMGTSSGNLAAGAKIVDTITVPSGMRPVICVNNSKLASLSIRIKGAYSYISDADYGTLLEFTMGNYIYGRKYYKGADNTTEVAFTNNSDEYTNSTYTIEAGKTYRITAIGVNGAIGFETAQKSAEIFNTPAIANYSTKTLLPYVDYSGTIQGIDGGIITTQYIVNPSNGVAYYIKEVSA